MAEKQTLLSNTRVALCAVFIVALTIFSQETLQAEETKARLNPANAVHDKNKQLLHTAKSHIKAREYDAALVILNALIEETKTPIAYFERAKVYLEKKDYKKAIADFDTFILFEPNSYRGHYLRATTYYHSDNYNLALRDYSQAIKIDPTLYQAYYGRGMVYEDMGQLVNALIDQREAHRLGSYDPDTTRAMRRLEERLRRRKDDG